MTGRYERSSVVIYGNVAAASHGESVHGEVLGDGDAARGFQSFALKKQPVTYVPEPGAPGGVASTLQLRVDGVRWAEVPELYGQPPDARVHVARRDAVQETTVRAGDGDHGARVPSGRNNVTADYRVGLGPDGNVRAGSLRTLLKKPLGLKRVTNPAAAAGGGEPGGSGRDQEERAGHGPDVRPDRTRSATSRTPPASTSASPRRGPRSSGTARRASSAWSSPASRAPTSTSPHPASSPTSTRGATGTSRCVVRELRARPADRVRLTIAVDDAYLPAHRPPGRRRRAPGALRVRRAASSERPSASATSTGRPACRRRRLGRRRRVPVRDRRPAGRVEPRLLVAPTSSSGSTIPTTST